MSSREGLFSKAYNYISWDYLRNNVGRMGFGPRWMLWMNGLIFNNSMSILVNGSPTDFFYGKRTSVRRPAFSFFPC